MNLSEVKRILTEKGIRLRKKWGQNFLFDRGILHSIVQAAEVSKADLVVEVGPGAGTLTEHLLETGAKVIAVEIDRGLCDVLNEHYGDRSGLKLFSADILKCNINQLIKDSKFTGFKYIKVVSNLPYYITSPVIMYFLESGIAIKQMLVTVQKEVAERITAQPGTKDYGILSIASQFYADIKICRKIRKECFFPVPKVDSSLVKFDIYDKPKFKVKDKDLFFSIVKKSFSQRRKTIKNNLQDFDGADILKVLSDCNIDPSRRPETLSIEEYVKIAGNLA
ncbi:16S rRNA (adenine(1518)-N(6)/adenine(1519)-N(6))-dimethyltransferase RsmA [Candidatus Auribacterota bacterium]